MHREPLRHESAHLLCPHNIPANQCYHDPPYLLKYLFSSYHVLRSRPPDRSGCHFITHQCIETKRVRLISDPFVIVERNKKSTVITCLQESGYRIDINRSHSAGTDFLFRFDRKIGQYIFLTRIKIEILSQLRKLLIRIPPYIYVLSRKNRKLCPY